MKKNIFYFCIIIITVSVCLISCAPDKVNIKMFDNGQVLQGIENRADLSIGDTCIFEEHWQDYMYGRDYTVSYSIVTKEEMQRHLKNEVVWRFKGDSHEYLVENVTFRKGIIIK